MLASVRISIVIVMTRTTMMILVISIVIATTRITMMIAITIMIAITVIMSAVRTI